MMVIITAVFKTVNLPYKMLPKVIAENASKDTFHQDIK
jgi:hypothetical protein